MANNTSAPFRADHVGSLLRPEPLLAARAEHEKDWITAETLRGCEDECIKKAVAMQAELGLKGVTDGEFRRGSWHMDFLYQIGGVAKTDQTLRIQFRNESGNPNQGLQIDGDFGSQTDATVRAFQHALSLDIPTMAVDGIVGPMTWQGLVSGMLSG